MLQKSLTELSEIAELAMLLVSLSQSTLTVCDEWKWENLLTSVKDTVLKVCISIYILYYNSDAVEGGSEAETKIYRVTLKSRLGRQGEKG